MAPPIRRMRAEYTPPARHVNRLRGDVFVPYMPPLALPAGRDQRVAGRREGAVEPFARDERVCPAGPRTQPGPDNRRRGAGVVERGGLENRCARERTEGSNPSLSAINL